MILELKNQSKNAPITQGGTTLQYNTWADLKPRLSLDLSTYDSLVLWGSHGDYAPKTICSLSETDVKQLVTILQNQQARFTYIVLDACFSAVFIPLFKPVLQAHGLIFCQAGISICQVFQEGSDAKTPLRKLWFDQTRLMEDNFKSVGPEAVEGYIPAVYYGQENNLYCFESGVYEKSQAHPYTATEKKQFFKLLATLGFSITSLSLTATNIQTVEHK